MSTALLIPGGFHGGWCWQRVARPLRREGWDVLTPSLTGVSDRSDLASPEVRLETHVSDVVNLIEAEEIDDLVLCAHSAGGVVASVVADRLAARIRHVVYLDAMVPANGQSFFDVIGEDLGMPQMLRDQADLDGDGWLVPPVPFFTAASLGVTDPEDAAWVNRRLTSHPIGPLEDKARLSSALDALPKTFVRAERLEVPSLDELASALEASPNWSVERWDTGHDLMITDPDRVVDLLRRVAG